MPSFRQILFSICPRFDAAAVCTSALWPSFRIVTVMASAVIGLTNHDAPSAAVIPAGSGVTSRAFSTRNCEYIAPPTPATILPTRACACGDDPAFTTTPAPSLPTGMDSSSRAASAPSTASGTSAVTTGLSFVPPNFAVERSAGPSSRPRSDGLIGVASTRTTTSSAAGSGVGIRCSDNSSSPLFLTSDRSWRPDSLLIWFFRSVRQRMSR